jgi:hypothetical protein
LDLLPGIRFLFTSSPGTGIFKGFILILSTLGFTVVEAEGVGVGVGVGEELEDDPPLLEAVAATGVADIELEAEESTVLKAFIVTG